MSDYDEPISDETKVEIAAEFMKYAPPGEFNEVYNDVAKLVDNPELLKQATSLVILFIFYFIFRDFLMINLKFMQSNEIQLTKNLIYIKVEFIIKVCATLIFRYIIVSHLINN